MLAGVAVSTGGQTLGIRRSAVAYIRQGRNSSGLLKKETIEYSANLSNEDAAQYLESLARSLREGMILLEPGDRSITLEVGPGVQFKLEAESSPEKGKHSLELALTWRLEEQVKPQPTLASDAPIPRPAPVTTTTRSSRSPMLPPTLPSAHQLRGSPSPRWAMMLRWISDVPPAIVDESADMYQEP